MKNNKIVSVSRYHSAGSQQSWPPISRQFLLFWVSASTRSIFTPLQPNGLKPASFGRGACHGRVLVIKSGQNSQFFACRWPMISHGFSQYLPCFFTIPRLFFHRRSGSIEFNIILNCDSCFPVPKVSKILL